MSCNVLVLFSFMSETTFSSIAFASAAVPFSWADAAPATMHDSRRTNIQRKAVMFVPPPVRDFACSRDSRVSICVSCSVYVKSR